MPPIKVLHLIPTLSSGGAERQLVNVVAGTSKKKVNHVVCVIGGEDFFSPAIRQAGCKVVELNISAKRPFFQAAAKFRQIVREENPDIIHSWLYDANIAARLAVLTKKKAILITSLQAANYEPESIKSSGWSPQKVNALRLIDMISAKLTNSYFVACSRFVAKSYQKELGVKPSRMCVIYNSVDPQILDCGVPNEPQKMRQSLGIPDDVFVYLNVGRLDPQKGQSYLLRAFRKVLEKVPQAYLAIIGAGLLEDSLKELAKSLEIENRVFFLGITKKVGVWLAAANAFVFPSLSEGLPLALLEAMAQSLPCIVSDIEVHREVVDDKVSALLVAPKSETELAEAMIQICEQPKLREKLTREAFQKVKNHFFSQVLMPQWEKLYADVLSDLQK